MEEEEIMQIANTILSQLLATTPRNVLFSWGALQGFKAAQVDDMAGLKFRVNGRLFKGYVIIAYCWNDTYSIYLQDDNEVRLIREDVYFDEMTNVIDIAIERGLNEAEYSAFCEAERQKLLHGDFS